MWPLLLVCLASALADMNDVDSMDSSSDTGGMDRELDNNDPNLLNPQPKHNYVAEQSNLREDQKGQKAKPPPAGSNTKTKRKTWSEQSYLALLEFGIIVGVAIMVGSMFMAMVGAEMLYDHLCDKARELFKKQKPLPDIERLHPAELVGTFSRYK